MDPFWHGLWDFLSFRTLISPAVLIGFYLIGAVFMPALAVGIGLWVRQRLLTRWRADAARASSPHHFSELASRLPTRWRVGLMLTALFIFVLLELFWRMLFEFLIAYLHMAEDLHRLVPVRS